MPKIPERTSSKRSRMDLNDDVNRCRIEVEKAKRAVRPIHSFDGRYRANASKACDALFKCLDAGKSLAVHNWIELGEGSVAEWWRSEEARRIVEQMGAASLQKQL